MTILGCSGNTSAEAENKIQDTYVSAEAEKQEDGKEENMKTEPSEQKREYTPHAKLPSEIDSFAVQIEDNLYQFPLMYQEFIDTGWSIDEKYESLDGTILSYCDESVWFKRGNIRLNVSLYNPDGSVQTYDKCVVAGIAEYEYDGKYKGGNERKTEIFIPGGFEIGVAHRQEVESAFRKADDT